MRLSAVRYPEHLGIRTGSERLGAADISVGGSLVTRPFLNIVFFNLLRFKMFKNCCDFQPLNGWSLPWYVTGVAFGEWCD